MTKKIIFASFNKNKVKEVQEMLNLYNINILSLSDLKTDRIPEAVEDGNSFHENALIKARHYYNLLKMPVISDDSGLVVPALNNGPGIYSARYAGSNSTDEKNNKLLLKKIKDFSKDQRKAFFQTVVIYKDELQERFFEGTCQGLITRTAKGHSGFGYDPIFLVPELNKTFAELSISEKSKISHRGVAIRALKDFLKSCKSHYF